MTPKEYADQLFREMYEVRTVAPSDISKYFAKQCALVAVNAIIRANGPSVKNEYWDRVKEEIEKI